MLDEAAFVGDSPQGASAPKRARAGDAAADISGVRHGDAVNAATMFVA